VKISFLTEKLPYYQICGAKVFRSYKKRRQYPVSLFGSFPQQEVSLHVRFRILTPVPHDFVQLDHFPHFDQHESSVLGTASGRVKNTGRLFFFTKFGFFGILFCFKKLNNISVKIVSAKNSVKKCGSQNASQKTGVKPTLLTIGF